MTRGRRRAMPLAATGLLVALQWCSRCRVHGREYDLRLPSGVGSAAAAAAAAAAAEATPPAESTPRRRPHLRHLRSAAPERPGGSLEAVAAVLGGDGGSINDGFDQRRSLFEDLEAYVDSNEACASRMEYTLSQCDFQNRQTLEWSYGEGDNALNCETPLPEGGSVKCDHVEWSSGEGIAIGILAGVGVALSLCFWGALSRYKQSRVVRLGQPALSKTFVVGIGVTFLSIFALLGATTDLTCALRLWGYSAGFDLAFGALTLKMRSACSAAESSMKQAYGMKLSRRVVLLVLLLDVAGDVAVLSRWTASFGENCGVEYESVGGGAFIRRSSCVSCNHGLMWSWIALKVVLVLFCCYVRFQARKFQDYMRDNGGIGMATYNLGVAGILVAAVVWAEANAQVRRTTEGVAILLAGVGVLFPVLGTRVLRAKQELEGKALVGPSAAAAATGPGTGGSVGDALYGVGERAMDGDEYPEPRTTTPSGVSSVGGVGADGVGTGGGGSGRRRSREAPGGARGSAATYKAAAQGLAFDADYERSPQSIPSPLPPKEAAAFATATAAAAAAAALDEGNDSGGSGAAGKQGRRRRRLEDQPRPKAPPAASVICARPNPATAGGGGAMGAGGGGNFATTGGPPAGGGGRSSVVQDQSTFWTPPRKGRRARSSVEMITRSADAMVLAAAAAGRAKGTGGLGGGDARGASRGAGRSASTVGSHRRKSSGASGGSGGGAGGGARQPGQRTSSAAMLRGIRGGDSHRGGGGGGGGGKGTMSVASGSSRASSRGRSARSYSLSQHSAGKTSHRSSGTTNNRQCASTTSGGSACGETNSARSSRDSWAFDPIIMAINGYGWGVGHGHGGSKQITSGAGGGGGAGLGGSGRKQRNTSFSGSCGGGGGGGGGGQRGSGRWTSGVRRRGKSKERAASVAGSAGGETRSSGVKSLVMFAEYGTRLHCPHCSKEVAGCGFRGCSGSLIRKPSFSDEFGPEESFTLPAPQPVRAPAFGGFTSALPGGGAGGAVGSSLSAAAAGAGGGDEMVPSGGGNNNMLSPSTQNCGSVRSASHRTTSGEGGGGGTGGGGAHKSLPMAAAASRLRMSFCRGPSPCDTFDNESDDDDDDDDDFDDYDDYEGQRSNFGINSPTSSYAWG